MNIWHYLFGLSGRINRAKMWAYYLVSFGLQLVFAVVQVFMPDLPDDDDPFANFWTSPKLWAIGGVLVATTVFFLYSYFAVLVKRLHDRDRSAWWVMIFFVGPLLAVLATVFAAQSLTPNGDLNQSPAFPIIVTSFVIAGLVNAWGNIEIYFLRGTAGDNRYGPDPLAVRAP
ncbi:MAG TPA: DUF805 domain-containing protein [Rhizomicrobium sp.]|jgi:uncharacterized membrane protein YhaH (DUF805 family)|nr:DUF805 domain-containing protein [Rhizomicrobium sp.]